MVAAGGLLAFPPKRGGEEEGGAAGLADVTGRPKMSSSPSNKQALEEEGAATGVAGFGGEARGDALGSGAGTTGLLGTEKDASPKGSVSSPESRVEWAEAGMLITSTPLASDGETTGWGPWGVEA